MPRIFTQDIAPSMNVNVAYSSCSSTQLNESPSNFSMTSTPSSVSSPSPGFPPPGFRQRTQSPTGIPVSRSRSGSINQLLNELGESKTKADTGKVLDAVRESTTSTSSSSTVRGEAGQENEKDILSNNKPPAASSSPAPAQSAQISSFGTFRSKSSNALPTRPSRQATPDLHTSRTGLAIPVIQSGLATGPGLVKTRSKSIGTVGPGVGIKPPAPRKGSAPSTTPTPPSPSHPPSNGGSRRPSITSTTPGAAQNSNTGITSPTIGFAYSSLPMGAPNRRRGDSIERGPRDTSPTRANSSKPSRPGLFSRGRSKTSDQIEPRKGPVAGTGHEGYSQYGRSSRGRSGSHTSTSGSWGRSGSQSSITSDSNFGSGSGRRSGSRGSKGDMDDYFVDKLKPVVLAGGGEIVENQNLCSPEYRPRNGSTSEQGGSAMSRSGSESMTPDSRAPGSRDGQSYSYTTGGKLFGARRAATPIPAPINTSSQAFRTSPLTKQPREVKQSVINAHTKLEKAFTPVLGQDAWAGDFYNQISPPLATDPLPVTLPTKTKRWNFLQRSQNSMSKNATVPVTGRRQARPPHYAILDPSEQQEALRMKDLMLELRNKAKEPQEHHLEANRGYTTIMRQQQHIHSILLPEPPLPPQSTNVPLRPQAWPSPPPTTSPSPGVNVTPALTPLPYLQSPPLPRKPTPESEAKKQQSKANERKRLQQGGARLPILGFGKKSNATKQSTTPISFPMQTKSSYGVRPSESEIQPIKLSSETPLLGRLPLLQTQFCKRMQLGGLEGWSAPHIGPAKHLENKDVDLSGYALLNTNENAIHSTVNEACGPLDVTGSELKNEVWPLRNDSTQFMPLYPHKYNPIEFDNTELPLTATEDVEDVWSEYDDLLEDKDYFGQPFSLELELEDAITSPRRSGFRSNTSSLGSPFQFDNLSSVYKAFMEEESVTLNNAYSRESPTLPDLDGLGPSCSSIVSDKTNSTIFELDESPVVEMAQFATAASVPPKITVFPLKEGQEDFKPPPTPFSMTKFLQYYSGAGAEDKNGSGVINAIDAVHHSTDKMKSRVSNGSNSSGVSNGSSTFSEVGLEDEMKLRLWALMASTWLNFDRVLVSPVHEELKSLSVKGKKKVGEKVKKDFEGRILVVDGLGTDEWSYYCALTYPSCKIYNLSPSFNPSDTATGQDSPTGLSKPLNHKQIHHTSFDTVFPFPVGFFNVVSLRFLPSSAYPSLPFILQQCQRVLAQGGYIEVAVLDADLVNMGNRAKRAVELNRGIMIREFEEVAAHSTPGTISCLSASTIAAKPASERVLRLLEKGFEDVNRCVVALPVMGHIDGSISLGSMHGSIDHTHNLDATKSAEVPEHEKGTAPKCIDAQNSNITDVVSKVGRYWYTRTYERVMTGEKGEAMGRSMWNDKGLLRECSKKKTGMRMLIAYGRKASAPPWAEAEPKLDVTLSKSGEV